MLIKESYSRDLKGARLYRTYSDKGMYIRKVGTNEVYEHAIDIEGTPYVYEETDKEIPSRNADKKK